MLLSASTMDNHEEILDALTAFGKNPNPQEIPSVLEQYLNSVAKNGETLFPWSQLKPLILRKMELVISELRRNLASENIPTRPNVENVRFDVIHARIIDSLHKFNGAPFTIQRLCELLIDPKRHYKRSDKFMRGLEKNVLVVSTVDPFGRKVVSEFGSKPVLNGILDINGSYPPRDTALSVPLPPVPGWVNTAAASRSSGSGAMDAANKMVTGSNLDGKDSDGVASNGLAVSGAQVFADQGDPLAVHSEEVVEETVVTMDTSEVSSVVTDGGEALADREMEADVGDASSFSSSSSSSSEELSTSSDSIENNLRSSTSPLGIAGGNVNEGVTAMDENRPWAAFAQDMKQQQDEDDLGTTTTTTTTSTISTSFSSNQSAASPPENQTSGVSSSSSPLNTILPTDAPPISSSLLSSSSSAPLSESPEKHSSSLQSTSSTDTTSKLEEGGEQEQEVEEEENNLSCLISQQKTTTSSDQPNWQQQQQSSSNESSSSTTADHNESFGFDTASTSKLTNDTVKITAAETNKIDSSSASSSTVTTTTTTSSSSEKYSNTTSSTIHPSTSSLSSSSSSSSSSSFLTSSDGLESSQHPTYAQVVASSTTDKIATSNSIQHISPYDSTTEPVPACDSVAGLERLVGSVEQSLLSSSSTMSTTVCPSSSSSSLSSSSSSSSPPSLTTTTTTPCQNNSSAVTTSSLPESSSSSSSSSRMSSDSSHQTTPSSSSSCHRPESEEDEPVKKRLRLSVDEESMDEDGISTSGNPCTEQGQNTIADVEEQQQQLNKEDNRDAESSGVDSSSVEEGDGPSKQAGETLCEDIQMEEEESSEVTTGTLSTVGDVDEKEDGVGSEPTGNVVDGSDGQDVSGSDGGIESSSSSVSTTDNDNKATQEEEEDKE